MLPATPLRLTRLAMMAASYLILPLATAAAHAGPDDFGPGPLIPDYGQIAPVDMTRPLPAGAFFQIAFDTATRSETDSLNRTLTSAARLFRDYLPTLHMELLPCMADFQFGQNPSKGRLHVR